MTDLLETEQWENGIYQIEETDPVYGGPPDLAEGLGISNVQAQQLANRTGWLKEQLASSTSGQSLLSKMLTVDGPGSGLNADQLHGKTLAQLMADVQSLLDGMVNGAPGALDTLNELAASLGDDANFAATMTSALAGKLGVNAKAANSDQLNGMAAHEFAQRDEPNSFSEEVTFGDTVFVGRSGWNGVIQMYDETNETYRGLFFHPGAEEWRIEDKDSVSRRVWHNGNDGAGSGLDADSVDGLQGSQFVRTDQNSTISNGLTVEKTLTVGANGEGGSVINFYDDNSNTTRTLMWNDVYNNWQVEDNSGALHELLHAGNAEFVDKGLGISSVESYFFAEGYAANPGVTKAGSGLTYSSTQSAPYTSATIPGTCRCHGYAPGSTHATLWKRIA